MSVAAELFIWLKLGITVELYDISESTKHFVLQLSVFFRDTAVTVSPVYNINFNLFLESLADLWLFDCTGVHMITVQYKIHEHGFSFRYLPMSCM
jgi:hypothetical protein